MTVLSAWLFIDRAPQLPDERQAAAARSAIVLCSFWGVMVCLSIYVLIHYRYARLRLTGDELVSVGPFAQRRISLSDVHRLVWNHAARGGTILLADSASSVRLYLDRFETEQQLGLIQFLRATVPTEAQTNWELFCHKVALPLTKTQSQATPDPDCLPVWCALGG